MPKARLKRTRENYEPSSAPPAMMHTTMMFDTCKGQWLPTLHPIEYTTRRKTNYCAKCGWEITTL